MYSKLAIKNLVRSLKEYTIYFFTLVFAICVFYTFNSIKSQSIIMDFNSAQSIAFELVDRVMSVASIFVAFILGFLIIYANNYLIKRRKKEFGIYMTLGMEKRELSKIVFIETLFIGVISLIIGILIGILASQGLSILTAKMFKINLIKFKFIFSYSAFLKTILCFGIIYIIVLLFNSIIINKVKLIDLLMASKKSEKLRIKNTWVSVIIFIVSICMIGFAYNKMLHDGIAKVDYNTFGVVILLGSIGTFLFFFSISGFFLKIIQSNKKLYLRDLNMFVFRQINSKINTVFISMTFICLMLFIAICAFSAGLGMNTAFNKDTKDLTQFDATFDSYNGVDIIDVLNKNGIDIKKYSNQYVEYGFFNSGVRYSDFLTKEGLKQGNSLYPVNTNQEIKVMKLSKFNHIMKILGKDTIKLDKDNYMVFGDTKDMIGSLQEAVNNDKAITINKNKLIPANKKVLDVTIYNQMIKTNICTFIVNDSVLDNLKPTDELLNVNLKDNRDDAQNQLQEKVDNIFNKKEYNMGIYTRSSLLASSISSGVVVAYLGIYIGVIFLITSAAILAIQQLCDSTENVERYRLLRKLGVDDKIINKSILIQTGIYFLVPLSLALVHSIVGLKISSDVVSLLGNASMIKEIIIAVIVLLIVYGGYFVLTYTSIKRMTRERLNTK